MANATITPGSIQMSAAQLTVNGSDIGATDGGITFTPTVTVQKVFVDQSSMPVRHFIVQEEVQVTTNLAEYTLDNLAKAIPGSTLTTDGTDPNKKKVEVGGGQIDNDNDYVELVITPLIDGSATLATDNNLKITIFKCIPTTHPELAFTKDGVRYIPVTWDAKRDETKDPGKQLYLLGDESATSS